MTTQEGVIVECRVMSLFADHLRGMSPEAGSKSFIILRQRCAHKINPLEIK